MLYYTITYRPLIHHLTAPIHRDAVTALWKVPLHNSLCMDLLLCLTLGPRRWVITEQSPKGLASSLR